LVERLILWQFITVIVEAERMCLIFNQFDKYLVSG
jgi:hypothetical protein